MAQAENQSNGPSTGGAEDAPGGVPAAEEALAQLRRELEEKLQLLSQGNRQLKRKIFDLYTIFEISRNFNAVLDYKSLLDSFIFTCLGQVGALKGAVFLKKKLDDHAFYLAKAKGSGPLPDAHDSFSDDTKLTSYLTRLNRPVLVDELTEDIASPDELSLLRHFAGGIIVPLIYKTRLAGLFLLSDRISRRQFGSDEVEFLSALGNQISVAIENARLFEAEKAANEQLWATQRLLVQSERMAALGEMSAKIAHEVNNPLGIIKNYVTLLKRAGNDNQAVVEYAGIVSQEIDRIADIVRELREFQRPLRSVFQPVDVRAVLDDTLTLMDRQFQASRIQLVREYDAQPCRIMGNSDSLKQVFLNLAINARAAMENGGTLRIGLETRGSKARLTFTDSGGGIPPEIVPRIFEPFFTTKGMSSSGLGLSICQGIIRSHNGSITFRNVGNGGCFEIILPLAPPQ